MLFHFTIKIHMSWHYHQHIFFYLFFLIAYGVSRQILTDQEARICRESTNSFESKFLIVYKTLDNLTTLQ